MNPNDPPKHRKPEEKRVKNQWAVMTRANKNSEWEFVKTLDNSRGDGVLAPMLFDKHKSAVAFADGLGDKNDNKNVQIVPYENGKGK